MNGVDVKISTLDAAARKCTSPGTLGVKVNVAKPSASLTLLTLPAVPTLPAELAAEPRADRETLTPCTGAPIEFARRTRIVVVPPTATVFGAAITVDWDGLMVSSTESAKVRLAVLPAASVTSSVNV